MLEPFPKDTEDFLRWQHTRTARRILYGDWKEELRTRVSKQISSERQGVWGDVDLSANLFRNLVDEVAVLYDEAPNVLHTEDEGILFSEALEWTGLWSLMARVQRDTIGLRECLVRIEIDESGILSYIPVFPDQVIIRAQGNRPDKPVVIKQLLKRKNELGKECWVYDVFDISDSANPSLTVHTISESDTIDETEKYLGQRFDGEEYPYRYADGTPFIPFVLYHAAHTGKLFDYKANTELIEGTLNVGVNYTFFSHCIRNASWPQRWAIGIEAVGAVTEDGRQALTVDPTTVAVFDVPESFTGSPSIGQWNPASSPVEMIEAIGRYERRLAAFAGIKDSDVQRISGDPRSGYALAISREGKREMQKRYMPQFRRGDLELISKSAAVSNRLAGTAYPEDGYQIVYKAIPKASDEMTKEVDRVLKLVSAGLLNKVDAYLELNPGKSRGEAEAYINQLTVKEE